jgi:putative ABC transport system ATP-binding protein
MIVVRALTKRVATAEGELAILKGLDLEIKAGESVAIVGASGSGKSTLLGLLAGLDNASSGQIIMDGVDLTLLDEEQRAALRARLVGFVFQNFQLLPTLTALENVMLPLELSHRALSNQQEVRKRAGEFLAQVGLSHRQHHYPRQLSGGEQQRVAIARAFAIQPKILFADEPTGNLDKKNAQRIADVLFELNAQHHTTLVLVTHDMRLAERCQRILWMDEGLLFDQEPSIH